MTIPRATNPLARSTGLLLRRVTESLVVLVLFVASGMGAQAADPPLTVSDADRSRLLEQIDAVGRRGFLYEVSRPAADNGRAKRLFLYGTIHVGRVGSDPFNRPVVDALRRSRRLALEADPTDTRAAQRLVVELGHYEDGDGLDRHVPPPLLARVEAFGTTAGIPTVRIARLKPWLLANMVTLKQMNASGLDADLGSELYLAGFARGTRMSIVEIEGIEAQLRLLAELPDPLQAAQLDEALTDAGSTDRRDEGRALFEMWLAGDAAAAEALIAEMRVNATNKPFERYFVDTLIDERNRAMADKAENYLERPGNTFFAVGSLHLFGDAGLIRTLERRGYRVVDLQAPIVPR